MEYKRIYKVSLIKKDCAPTRCNRAGAGDYSYDLVGNIKTIDNNHVDFVTGNIGGNYNYKFGYDELYRLTNAGGSFSPYNMTDKGFDLIMDYSASGNIENKKQDAQKLINGSIINTNYNNYYFYNDRPHNVTETTLARYDWDLNGNMIHRRDESGDRFMCWDEENRLTAVRDVGHLSQSSIYLYDAGGERVWKLTGPELEMQLNAQTVYTNVSLEKTLYASPLMVMTEEEYTKHYYIEGERICSKLGGGFGVAPQFPTGPHVAFIFEDAVAISKMLKNYCNDQLKCVNYEGSWEIGESLHPAHDEGNDPEGRQFFYHSDHLGSSSFITAANGRADQHIQYLPYGELFVSQKNSSFDSRYKFTAKELDNETNYTYFGARYYDSDLSSWLSVDPLSHKYPSLSPYNYCAGNPVILVDPDGEDPIYAKNFWGNVKKIGDDGKTSTGSYLVTGSVKKDVKVATKSGQFYTGSLTESANVMIIPTGQIQQDVQQTVTATANSGTTPQNKIENGGHSLAGDNSARIWDSGTQVQTSVDAMGNTVSTWSITPFKIGGKTNQIGGPASSLQFVWHTHPNTANPSDPDIKAAQNWKSCGYNGNPFVIGQNKVTFYNGNGIITTIKYNDFKRMGNQEDIK